MKKIEAVIRPEKFEDLKEALFSQTNVKGITVSQILGCGQQQGWKEYFRGQEVMTTLLPKVQVNIVIADEDQEQVVDLILDNTRTEEIGDGKIFISEVSEAIRIRTGERGSSAL